MVRPLSASRILVGRSLVPLALIVWIVGCQSADGRRGGSIDLVQSGLVPVGAVHAEDLLVVDCLLPGRVRKLGRSQVYMTPRHPVKTSAIDCEIRGGEYTAYDRADYQTALRVWMDDASQGDATAQNYVGEIYERGLGAAPDYAEAAQWYRRAADQGFERAMLNLGQLYELGRGVDRDSGKALDWYRKASGLEEAGVAYQIASSTSPGEASRRDEVLMAAASSPPSIQLIEPPKPATPGLKVVSLDITSLAPNAPRARILIGRVIASGGLLSLLVNDVERPVDSEGLFRAEVPVATSGSDVVIAAIDRQGRRSERRLRLEISDASIGRSSTRTRDGHSGPRPRVDFGHYNALVIGNGAYRSLPRLETARADADAVAQVLRDRYGFRVKLMRDATRYEILSALNEMRATLTDEDNLLVYYAGHGDLDKVNMRGQWLPIDAERDSSANWISNVAITDILNTMNARHVLVVSDSCYSGALTRSSMASLDAALSDEKRAAWLRALSSKRSRTALTSGGLAPVLDEGGGGHSIFARAFIDVLQQNESVLEGQRLYQELAARVAYAAQGYQFEQLPQYAPIKFAGHDAGDFFLVPEL
jgi:hypothetical protein